MPLVGQETPATQNHQIYRWKLLLMQAKTLSYQSFDQIPINGPLMILFGYCHTQTGMALLVFSIENRKLLIDRALRTLKHPFIVGRLQYPD